MKKIIISLVILAIIPTVKVFNQTINSVNICNEVDWRTNQEMIAKNDSIFEIDLDYTKSKDINKDGFVYTKFKILYDNGYKWIGGTFPTDTIGDMEVFIPVPIGFYKAKINIKSLKYQFINSESSFYTFSTSELDSNEFIYCEIVGYSKPLSNKVTVDIDFGQYRPKYKDNRLTDNKTGDTISFNSMVDALNFMGKLGWEFVQAYTITMGNQNVYHFLMKKYNR